MSQYFELPIDGHAPIRVEVEDSEVGMVPAGAGPGPGRFKESLNEALDRIRPVAEAIAEKVAALPSRPEQVQAELGMKFSTDLGVVIARSKAESHITITLTWSGSGGTRHDETPGRNPR
ncbi:CU044_2847 family protein [Nocardiopsis suaedae]|uniref:CU044_2847 family protein n=1 Tax=Nocardiopsis suaedae TaxID=3018444 RepID=A0ABT4TP73_9ACTN|nr:CU044_2847 family protein [Nocardiopsis suaedae]MDA2806473.1 CU044_2847 family protein [Nocardiopsis suaedae]